jgi:uncharacterized membrane protein YgcG
MIRRLATWDENDVGRRGRLKAKEFAPRRPQTIVAEQITPVFEAGNYFRGAAAARASFGGEQLLSLPGR